MSPLRHVLLVDDDLDHIRLTRHVIQRDSPATEIDSVRDGESAIEYLRSRATDASRVKPELVVLDLHLPRMQGLDVLRTMKGDAQLKDIPVVVMSSQLRLEDALQARQLGATAVLSKSAGPEAISDALETLGIAGSGPLR
jgi:CheY-like chemotaxis protein